MAGKITHIKKMSAEICGYWPGKNIRTQQYALMGIDQPLPGHAPTSVRAHQLTFPARMEGVTKGFLSGSYAAIASVCPGCPAPCVSLRVNVSKFNLSARQHKMMNDGQYNYDFKPTVLLNPHELYRVFRAYTSTRHNEKESGMRAWTMKTFREWLDFMPFAMTARTVDGQLAGFAAVGAQKNFAVLDYLVFDPQFAKDSIGKRLWLQMMTEARDNEIAHVYVGSWSKDSPKLDYKRHHSGLETIENGRWVDFDAEKHARGTDFRALLNREGFEIS